MSRLRVTVALVALVAAAALALFAGRNLGDPVVLDFWLVRWRGDTVVALFAAVVVGLVLMFLVGLPADLASRREMRRMRHRLAELERDEPARRGRPAGADAGRTRPDASPAWEAGAGTGPDRGTAPGDRPAEASSDD